MEESTNVSNEIERIRRNRQQKITYYTKDPEEEIGEIKRKDITNYWLKIGKWRDGEDGEENKLKAEKILEDFKKWVKETNIKSDERLYSIEWARNALQIDYKLWYEYK